MKKTLRLSKETLAELSSAELSAVAGARPTETLVCPSIPLWSCISCDVPA
jgi:hypothetical protein